MVKRLMWFLQVITVMTVQALAYDNKDVHPAINNAATEQSILSNVLIQQLGIASGIKTILPDNKTVVEWVSYGGNLEDVPDYRASNHFHDPLRSWEDAGFKGSWLGNSSLIFAQDQRRYEGQGRGNWSWPKARQFYYEGLTLRGKDSREEKLAYTFRAIGQIMHLLSDASVPAHVRNDNHVFGAIGLEMTYENWAQANYRNHDRMFIGKKVDPVIFNAYVADLSAPAPITALWDKNVYNGANPQVTWTTNSTISEYGLSEYTNANFFSEDTIFVDYPHPKKENTTARLIEQRAKDGKLDNVRYVMGYQTERLAAYSYFMEAGIEAGWKYHLDEFVYEDYAKELLPRAVGYSAGLLNYFFRGDIRLEHVSSPASGYRIVNRTKEDLNGLFQIYYDNKYDNKSDERMRLHSWAMPLSAESQSGLFDITPPSDAKEPGRYILVFQGTMGSESGAVAGYVLSRQLEITPPARYVYSLVTAEEAEPQFSWLTATIRNSTADTMKNGSLQAIVRYMKKTGDQSFLSARSLPLTDITLGHIATAFTFDFSASPIPVDAKDLLLEVIFTGTIGAEQGAVAQGIRNISEPTPIDIFNNTDRSCINGKWYSSSTAAAEAAVDSLGNRNGRADERDIHPHRIRDISIAISSPSESVPATNENHDFSADVLEPGQFKRLGHILTEAMFRYSNRARWEAVDSTDKWNHFELTYGNEGRAVQEQAEVTSDTTVCGKRVPCSHDVKPQYYDMRGNQMWWGGGLVYVNQLYPAGTSCEGF